VNLLLGKQPKREHSDLLFFNSFTKSYIREVLERQCASRGIVLATDQPLVVNVSPETLGVASPAAAMPGGPSKR